MMSMRNGYLHYGVVGNTLVFHTGTPGSIPGNGIIFKPLEDVDCMYTFTLILNVFLQLGLETVDGVPKACLADGKRPRPLRS